MELDFGFTDLSGTFSVMDVVLSLALAFVCSLVVAWTYRASHRNISYSQSYVHTLIILGMLIALIMLIVGSNIARAFALVGALSVVRFRNAIKETRDVGFIFLVMGVGMACGTRFYVLAVLATLVILFMAFRSVLLPLKATILNLLSLSVMFGALVFVFQQGNFSDLLGFTPTGTLEISIPILMFCVTYGLSMDYEVFMLARIKEEYDRTGDNTQAVAYGLQYSAPLISAAAIILALSFLVYLGSGIVFLKMLGLGTALAILVDATLIRAVLVPASMRLAGNINWWAPPTLQRLHSRIGLRDG
jgi:hypothetical protein